MPKTFLERKLVQNLTKNSGDLIASACFCMPRWMQRSMQHFFHLLTTSVADNTLPRAPLRRQKIGVFSDPSEYLGWAFSENTERKGGLKVCYCVSLDASHQVYIIIVSLAWFLAGISSSKLSASNISVKGSRNEYCLKPWPWSRTRQHFPQRVTAMVFPYARQGPVQTQT